MMITSLAGQAVTRVSFEYGIRLVFDDRSWVVIEEKFDLTQGGQTWSVDPEIIDDNSPRVLFVLHDILVDGRYSDEGGLWLRFEKGTLVTVPPSWDYEAWSMGLAATGSMLVSGPGGGGVACFGD